MQIVLQDAELGQYGLKMHSPGALDQDSVPALKQGRKLRKQILFSEKPKTPRFLHSRMEQRAYAQDQIDARLLRFPGHPLVESGGLIAQLQHVPQDTYLSAACPG